MGKDLFDIGNNLSILQQNMSSKLSKTVHKTSLLSGIVNTRFHFYLNAHVFPADIRIYEHVFP